MLHGIKINMQHPEVRNTLKLLSNEYCFCTEDLKKNSDVNKDSNKLQNEEMYQQTNFETYKQIKEVSLKHNHKLTKEQMYEKMLKPFKHKKIKTYDFKLHRHIITYVCDYENCGKEFAKTWNLLDHVRMHEGIKPYQCQKCGKEFTQKGNLKKHLLIQHSKQSLDQRKKFKCTICQCSYTERYNLVVSFIDFYSSKYFLFRII